jgi:hypothetical protein
VETNNPIDSGFAVPRAQRWLINFLLVLMGLALAGLLVVVLFRVFPGLLPNGRARSVDMGVIRFTSGMGDMFFERPGLVAPPPDPYKVLSEHRLAWDADGFRVPAHPSDHYDVVALGDSYTEAANVARPWPDVLADRSGLAVRNLGFRGYGPVEELRVLRDYGVKSNPRLIILAFFEGNDLNDVMTASSREFTLPELARRTFAPYDPNDPIWKSNNPGPFPLPVRFQINGKTHEMAFLDSYLSWLNAEREVFASSENMAKMGQVWNDMARAAGSNACLAIAYFPSSPHIYAPYIVPQDRDRMMSTVQTMYLDRPGTEIQGKLHVDTFQQAMALLDSQRDAVQDLAAQQGRPFIDLVPAFKQAAAQGKILYYTYDTHPNQSGHDLAGQVIADFLAQHPNPCADQTAVPVMTPGE